ncbi:MAG: hypothetical protein ACRCXL_04970 [Dermatophilaceae bacterium]
MDRDEADLLSWSNDRKDRLIESAERWEQQAHDLVLERVGARPSLATVEQEVGSEDWLAGLALLGLCPVVARDAARFTEWSRDDGSYTYDGEREDRMGTFHPQPLMDWAAWAADVDGCCRGWSTTEWRLYELVTGITVEDRPMQLSSVLTGLGSWEAQALTIVVEWASGGNQRDLPGRVAVGPAIFCNCPPAD